MKSYKDLEIYQIAYRLAKEVHAMSMTLPKYELFENGSQVRRASRRIKDTIAEGYGRGRYKDDFIKYLVYAIASCDETTSHLNMISDLHFINTPLTELINEYEILGKKLNKFIQWVEDNWNANK
ncbi:MAG: four helix bundle protein [Chitinophagaceae bacterium]|jgi:four helix bundle protein|nr:MAG: four helix bundle protein [Chitinophagaceae bacterium]